MTFRLGLTGSIGMGKSATANLFRELGCPVWDADAAVHRLYGPGGAAVDPIADRFPGTVVEGQVDRDALKATLANDPEGFADLERIVHPLVARDRALFLESNKADIVVFDVPLLFETGGDKTMDATITVSIDADTQAARVLDRGTMSRDQFQQILARQMPDAEKRARSDYVIVTDTPEHARDQVLQVLADIRSRL